MEEYKKWLQDKSVSMNEADRLGEQKEKTAKAEARKKDWMSRKKPEEKVYEITLKNVDDPVLQLKTNHVAVAAKPDAEEDSDAAEAAVDSSNFNNESIRLSEARRIMSDYISLLHKGPEISQAPISTKRAAGSEPGVSDTNAKGQVKAIH
jgi:hypothetical protein